MVRRRRRCVAKGGASPKAARHMVRRLHVACNPHSPIGAVRGCCPAPEGAGVARQHNTSSVAVHWALRLGPPLLYFAITLVFLLPLPLRLGSTVIKESPDIWIHLWWMWQVRDSVLAGQNPYETLRVFHPTGAPLYLMGQDMV